MENVKFGGDFSEWSVYVPPGLTFKIRQAMYV